MSEVYAVDLDEEVLSHLAIPESVQEFWIEEVDPDDLILDDFVKQVWDWQFAHLREHSKPATASVLAEQFDLELADPLTVIGDLIERLRDRWMRNNVRGYMEEIGDAYKEEPSSAITVIQKVGRELQEKVGKRGEAFGSGDYERAMHQYNQMVLRGPGASFGFSDVDDHFHGLRGVTFGIAPPKTYKSWIFGANTVVENVALGRHAWLYSLELPAEETDMRVRCLAAGIPYWRYLRGSLSANDRSNLKQASEFLDDTGRYQCMKPQPGHRTFEEMVERAGDAGADFVIIDQLQYVETRTGKQLGGCDPREFWQPLNQARDMSDAMPMMVIHQFNRSVMNADRMPEMQQAKGASAIEEVATLALGLWANKDMRKSNIVEMGTLAARNWQYQSWEIGVELTKSANFEMLGRVDHDDDE